MSSLDDAHQRLQRISNTLSQMQFSTPIKHHVKSIHKHRKPIEPTLTKDELKDWFIVFGKTERPWWEITDGSRLTIRHRQYNRVLSLYRTTPATTISVLCNATSSAYPRKSAKMLKRPTKVGIDSGKKFRSTHICTLGQRTDEKQRKKHILSAPYKRPMAVSCELCGSTPKRLGWHHWIDANSSVGMWLCLFCNVMAEAIETSGQQPARKYVMFKGIIDDEYSRYSDYQRLRTQPASCRCELCDRPPSSRLLYHLWDKDSKTKGIWVCELCLRLAERIDLLGIDILGKYTNLKKQDELRVLNIYHKKNIKANPSLFPSLVFGD